MQYPEYWEGYQYFTQFWNLFTWYSLIDILKFRVKKILAGFALLFCKHFINCILCICVTEYCVFLCMPGI